MHAPSASIEVLESTTSRGPGVVVESVAMPAEPMLLETSELAPIVEEAERVLHEAASGEARQAEMARRSAQAAQPSRHVTTFAD